MNRITYFTKTVKCNVCKQEMTLNLPMFFSDKVTNLIESQDCFIYLKPDIVLCQTCYQGESAEKVAKSKGKKRTSEDIEKCL